MPLNIAIYCYTEATSSWFIRIQAEAGLNANDIDYVTTLDVRYTTLTLCLMGLVIWIILHCDKIPEKWRCEGIIPGTPVFCCCCCWIVGCWPFDLIDQALVWWAHDCNECTPGGRFLSAPQGGSAENSSRNHHKDHDYGPGFEPLESGNTGIVSGGSLCGRGTSCWDGFFSRDWLIKKFLVDSSVETVPDFW